MATLTLTIAAGSNAGAAIRKLGRELENIAADMPDNPTTGASTVLTFDNSPAGGGAITVQVTAGPHQSSKRFA